MIKNAVMAGVSMLLLGSAQAAIIDHGTFLTDTGSGLDWLDVTLTANMARFLVERDMWAGGDLEGWRFATGNEFNALVSNWTVSTSSTVFTPPFGL
ncbi:MAG: hypothetical protein Q8O34_11700 [Rhodocyclaceae bacterium]|nr:hypothetical protein [Rhodocyclaceae bacterium]